MTDVNDSATHAEPAVWWRRILAFAVDCLVVGVIGLALGLTVREQLAQLGPWGRLVGFLLTLGYFGLMNSKLTGGQTLGKRLLKIRVVDQRGVPLPVARSFLRFVPLGLPWFLNGAPFSESVLLSLWVYLLSMVVFGAGLSIIYLFLFERPWRRSLDDLLVGSVVVGAGGSGAVAPLLPWRGHLAICAILVVAAALAPVFASKLAAGETFGPLLRIYHTVSAEPWVARAQVNRGTNYSGGGKTTYLAINAYLRDSDIHDSERAAHLASLAVTEDPSIRSLDVLQVTLAYGFDIGIAESWQSRAFSYVPKDLAATQPE